MKAVIKNRNTDKVRVLVQLTDAQVAVLRNRLKCQERPVQYAEGKMYAQGGGWYNIVSFADDLSDAWFSAQQAMFALLRKIRQIVHHVEMLPAGSVVVAKAVFGKTYVSVINGKVCTGLRSVVKALPATTESLQLLATCFSASRQRTT